MTCPSHVFFLPKRMSFLKAEIEWYMTLIAVLEDREICVLISVKHPGVATVCMNKAPSH